VKEAEIRAAEQDCARLITGYCQAADCDDVEAFVALFTTDAEWSSPTGSIVRGHDEMREYFAARPGNVVSAHLQQPPGRGDRGKLGDGTLSVHRVPRRRGGWRSRRPSSTTRHRGEPGRVRAHRARLADSPPPIPGPLRETVTGLGGRRCHIHAVTQPSARSEDLRCPDRTGGPPRWGPASGSDRCGA
jgi:hypothetical protein